MSDQLECLVEGHDHEPTGNVTPYLGAMLKVEKLECSRCGSPAMRLCFDGKELEDVDNS